MVGSTLQELLDQLRAEIGASANPAQGVNSVPYWQQVLTRTQRRLYAKRKWGHLWVHRDKDLQSGERYYTFPVDLDFSQITQAWTKYSTQWEEIGYGIGPAQYNRTDSDLGTEDQPICRWDHYEGNQFEVWPIPISDNQQQIRLYGYKNLTPLVALTDRADLDNDLIVLFAAAEILERGKSADAKSKAILAQDHYLSLVKNDTKANTFLLGGGCPPANAGSGTSDYCPIRVAKI